MNLPEFENQPLTDFSDPENRQAMEEAIAQVRTQLGREYDIIIGGEAVRTGDTFESVNPSRSDEVVGIFQAGKPDLANRAVEVAYQAFESWGRTTAEERVKKLLQVSTIMQERRLELGAWMVIEVGKSWVEADADVAEAIDFAEYYARQMLRLAGPQPLVRIPQEENELEYIPLGVGVVIAPWNFPLAILSGMTFATVVTGNTAVVKPSSDSATIAAQLMDIFAEAGYPPGVVNFVTGGGQEVGDPLVRHPKTRFIAFTGSKAVGLHINEVAAQRQPGQIWIKRVVAEMGGKDSIIVDEEAQLDEAVDGVIRSAFGFQGQKCSACSRAIVLDSVYDEFLERLREQLPRIVSEGSVEDPEVNFGPVINQQAQKSILEYIQKGNQEGRLIVGGKAGDTSGYFVKPTVFADVDPNATIAQEEIFGPVLAVIRARDYDHAIQIANNTEYGLTGAVYTENLQKLHKAKQEFHVGNLYFNRKCTGALVGVHPFGGFNMSGTDSKAGGPDYLLLFTQAKAISRKAV